MKIEQENVLSLLRESGLVQQRQRYSDVGHGALADVREALRAMPLLRLREASHPLDYSEVCSAEDGTVRHGYMIVRDTDNVDLVEARRVSERHHGKDRCQALNVNICRDDLPKAFDALKGIVFSEDSPFDEWRVPDCLIASDRSTTHAGAKLRFLVRPDFDKAGYSSKSLLRMRQFIARVESALTESGIRPGARPDSDLASEHWRYISYCDATRNEHEGTELLQDDLLFQVLADDPEERLSGESEPPQSENISQGRPTKRPHAGRNQSAASVDSGVKRRRVASVDPGKYPGCPWELKRRVLDDLETQGATASLLQRLAAPELDDMWRSIHAEALGGKLESEAAISLLGEVPREIEERSLAQWGTVAELTPRNGALEKILAVAYPMMELVAHRLPSPVESQRHTAGYPTLEKMLGPPHDAKHARAVAHESARERYVGAQAELCAHNYRVDKFYQGADEFIGPDVEHIASRVDAVRTKRVADLTRRTEAGARDEQKMKADDVYQSAYATRMKQYEMTSMPDGGADGWGYLGAAGGALSTISKAIGEAIPSVRPWHGGGAGTSQVPAAIVPLRESTPSALAGTGVIRARANDRVGWPEGIANSARSVANGFVDAASRVGAAVDRAFSSAVQTMLLQGNGAAATIVPPSNDTVYDGGGELDTDTIVARSSDSLHRATQTALRASHIRAQQYDRAERILMNALQRSGNMTEVEAQAVSVQARLFVDCVPKYFPNFAQNERLHEYMQRTRTREVGAFLDNKYRIMQEMVARPQATDEALLTYAQSMLTDPAKRRGVPVDGLEPFVRYLDKLRAQVEWVDWDKAKKQITNPLQAINALHLFNFGDDEAIEKLDGLALGEKLARGTSSIEAEMAAMSSDERGRLDAAAILYALSTGQGLRLSVPDSFPLRDTLPLGEQLYHFRRSLLMSLKDEWQMSRMFVPNADKSNPFVDQNAMINAQGKSWEALVGDQSIQGIPGFKNLPANRQREILKQRLERLGESTEYRFGTLQHALANVVRRSMLIQHKPVPDDLSKEEKLIEQFLALCAQWDKQDTTMLNPRIMLAQYMARAGNETITSPTATVQQNLDALQRYANERWLANYGRPMVQADNDVALKILKSRLGERATVAQLTVEKSIRDGIGMFSPEQSRTPVEQFVYLANQSQNRFVFMGVVFHPRDELTRAIDEENRKMAEHPWVLARAKENLRVTGRAVNAENTEAERQKIIEAIHQDTPADRERARATKILRSTPILGNLFRVGEGIYRGDWWEALGGVPVLGNALEFGAGLATGDARRAAGAIPLLGSGLELEDALRNGDTTDIALAEQGFIFDVLSLGTRGGSGGRGRVGGAARVTMKEAELPSGHAVGVRNALAMSKSLGIALKTHEVAAEAGERTQARDVEPAGWRISAEKPKLSLGDPYGIELPVNEDELSAGVLHPVSSKAQFGAEMESYRVDGPSAGIGVNAEGIYEEGGHRFIKDDQAFYAVRYDRDSGTWRVFDRNNGAKWAMPVRYKDGHWEYNDQAGLRGGAPLVGTALDASMDKLFNRNLKALDAFRARRERFVSDNDRAYPEGAFDVEGLPFKWKPATYPATGRTYFDIRTHGSATEVMTITGKAAGPKEFAAHFTGYVRTYKPGTPVRLIACNAGRGGRFSFAQRFADILGVPVLAYKARINLLQPEQARAYEKLFLPRTTGRKPRAVAPLASSLQRGSSKRMGGTDAAEHAPSRKRRLKEAGGHQATTRAAAVPRVTDDERDADSADVEVLKGRLRTWVDYRRARKEARDAETILAAVAAHYGVNMQTQLHAGLASSTFDNKVLLDEAAVLFEQVSGSAQSEATCTGEGPSLERLRAHFLDALDKQGKARRGAALLLNPPEAETSAETIALRVGGRVFELPVRHAGDPYFDGFVVRNAVGKTSEDLLNMPGISADRGFAELSVRAKRAQLVVKFQQAEESTQYPIGTVRHSLASTLYRVARYSGVPAPVQFADDEVLLNSFKQAEDAWAADRSIYPVHPRLLFALHLARTNGVEIVDRQNQDQRAKQALFWIYVNAVTGNKEPLEWLLRAVTRLPDDGAGGAALIDLLRDISLDVGMRPGVPAKIRELALQLKRSGLLTEALVGRNWQEKTSAVLRYGAERMLGTFGTPPDTRLAASELRTHPWSIARAKENVRTRSKAVTSAATERELGRIAEHYESEAAKSKSGLGQFNRFLNDIALLGAPADLLKALQTEDAANRLLGTCDMPRRTAVERRVTRQFAARMRRGFDDLRTVSLLTGVPLGNLSSEIGRAVFDTSVPNLAIVDSEIPLEHRLLAARVRYGESGVQWNGFDLAYLEGLDRVVPIGREDSGYYEIDWRTGKRAVGAKLIRRDTATGRFHVSPSANAEGKMAA